MRSLWLPTTTNRKTGNIPTSYIGQSVEAVRVSCELAGCALLGSNDCYAWYGTPRLAYRSMTRSSRDYSLEYALAHSVRAARYVRVGALGDPCALPRDEIATTREMVVRAGLRGVLGYTHGWRDAGAHLRGKVMASCDDMASVYQALDAGGAPR